ncbi:MAG: short-chain dehydrogenase [Meiothermus sp.]
MAQSALAARRRERGGVVKALEGRRIVVTGGTSGIGQAVAAGCAEAGADVAFCGLTEEGANETRARVEKAGGRSYFEAFDVADLDRLTAFARRAEEFLGGVDGLVNNAGSNFFRGVLGAQKADLDRCFAVDFYPAWVLSKALHPALSEREGVVVNIASVHAQHTEPGAFPYNAAKAALVALTQSQALEWGRDGIRAVAVAPGLIETRLAHLFFGQSPDPEAERARHMARHPIRRNGQPQDVASLIVYLLSPANRFLTGTTVTVDGGSEQGCPRRDECYSCFPIRWGRTRPPTATTRRCSSLCALI